MPKTYKTISGDTWDLIAFKTLGNEMHTALIMENNIKHRNVVIFPAGVVLEIPEIETPADSGLPPWKRGAVK